MFTDTQKQLQLPEHYCDPSDSTVEKRIINNSDMNFLRKYFIKAAMDIEGVDIGGYRNVQLKRRLQTRYSDLALSRVYPSTESVVILSL